MKKVKLMLLSLFVLTVVAGTLAFKAKGTIEYCTAPTHTTGAGCPTNYACPTLSFTLTAANPDIFICTAATVGGSQPCSGVICGNTSAAYRDE